MKYNLTIKTITPLHIGTGSELLKDFDYLSVSEADKSVTYVLNQEKIHLDDYERHGGSARLTVPAGRLISPGQLHDSSPFVRYSALGATVLERVHEQIKDEHNCCFIPGSSLKGAFRSALLTYAQKTGNLSGGRVHYEKNRKGNWVKESAASDLERIAFRGNKNDPNHDLLRVLQIPDTAQLAVSPTPLEISSVRVFTGGETDTPIAVEAVQRSQSFVGSLTIDELSLQFAEELGWTEEQLGWLLSLPQILQNISIDRIHAESKIAVEKGFERTQKFYRKLETLAQELKGTHAALLQLGWGTGWTGMTIGPGLKKEDRDEARQKFQLGRPPTQRGSWEPDLTKPFPKGRRLRSVGRNTPDLPFGWVAITFEPHGDPLYPDWWRALTEVAQAAFKPAPTRDNPVDVQTPPPDNPVPPAEPPDKPVPPAEPPAKTATPPPPPVPQKPPSRPFTASFDKLPEEGDRFKGEVFDSDGVYLEIPGLDADAQAYAYIPRVEVRRIPKDGVLRCEVIALEQEGSVSRVVCREV